MLELDRRPPPACRRITRPATDARAREIVPGIWSLQIPLCYISVASVNAYLLRADDGWIVWDCGSSLAPGWDAMKLALQQAGVRPRDVTLLVVSHAHTDHRGLAAEFVANTDARLASGVGPHPLIDVIRDPAIALEIRRERGRREGVPAFALDGVVDELPGMDTDYPAADPDLVLEPGASLQSRSGRWEVIAIPGHSADQIGLWNPGLRYLISADLAFDGIVSYLEYGTRPDPEADQLQSLDRAIALQPDLLLPGHGRPVADAVAVLRRSRQRLLERVQTVIETIDQPGRTAWDVAVALTPPNSMNDLYQRSLSEALSVLEHLEYRGRARSLIGDDRRRIWVAADA